MCFNVCKVCVRVFVFILVCVAGPISKEGGRSCYLRKGARRSDEWFVHVKPRSGHCYHLSRLVFRRRCFQQLGTGWSLP